MENEHVKSDSEDQNAALAIIGWAHKFPGDATTSDGFWKMLCEGRTAHGPIPKNKFNTEGFYHPDITSSGTTCTKSGHFLDEDPDAFDAPFFSILPAEAATMDPQQRLLLETTYHAFENAGLTFQDTRGSNTSVYIGGSTQDYATLANRDPLNPPKYLATGVGGSMLPSKISWFYDLRGESIYIDTACSSSLTCLHHAAQNLKDGKSDMAIVGGVLLALSPDTSFAALSQMGFLSPDGRSYSFDSRANGYAKGEGVGVVIVKRVPDAIRDGDLIRGVIRATATNQDGRTPGITQPSSVAQEENIRSLYERHGLNTETTRFVEAHGTGTQMGDPIEASAIVRAFRPPPSRPLYIGALKQNIGHLEPAAGIAGLIKVCMILEKGIIPPNPLFRSPNESIPVNEWNIVFPTQSILWPSQGLRRASLNSFGYGGTNAHAVLDDAFHYLSSRGLAGRHITTPCPSESTSRILNAMKTESHDSGSNNDPSRYNAELPQHLAECNGDIREKGVPGGTTIRGNVVGTHGSSTTKIPKIFVLSSSDEAGLGRLRSAYSQYLQRTDRNFQPEDESSFLGDLSYTLFKRRNAMPWKTYAIAATLSELQEQLSSEKLHHVSRSSDRPALAFIFTGQGAQWPRMGAELLRFSAFRESLQQAQTYYKQLGSHVDLVFEILRDTSNSDIDDPLIAQISTTAIQIALVDLLSSWNVFPDTTVGHSSGEIAAAYSAGGLCFESALRVAYYRGYFAKAMADGLAKPGGMIAISLSAEEVQSPMKDAMTKGAGLLVVACENSPSKVTISGDKACVEELNVLMESQNVFARQLNVPIAYHSPHMNICSHDYESAITGITGRHDGNSNTKPVMFSSVTGAPLSLDELSKSTYWSANSVSMVRFSAAVQAMCEFVTAEQTSNGKSSLLAVELGPHAALKRPLDDILRVTPKIRSFQYDHTLERNSSNLDVFLGAMARMYCHGISLNLDEVNNPNGLERQNNLLVHLPSYPFNHSQKYWYESRISREYRNRPYSKHQLLGTRSLDWNPLEPHWRHFLKHSENPWARDHCIDGMNVYPASGLIVMVLEAARQLHSPSYQILGYMLTDLEFNAALSLDDSDLGTEVQLRFHRPREVQGSSSLEHGFTIYYFTNSSWLQCAQGNIAIDVRGAEQSPRFQEYQYEATVLRDCFKNDSNQCQSYVNEDKFYQDIRSFGLEFGAAHQGLKRIRYSNTSKTACADIELDGWLSKTSEPSGTLCSHVIHPTALDSLVQIPVAAFSQGGSIQIPTMIPGTCGSIWISHDLLYRQRAAVLQAAARTTFNGFREADFDIAAFDEKGSLKVRIKDWKAMSATSLSVPETNQAPQKLCFSISWRPDLHQMSPSAIRSYCDEQCPRDISIPAANAVELLSMYYASIAVQEASALKSAGHAFSSHIARFVQWANSVYHQDQFDALMKAVPKGHLLSGNELDREQFINYLATLGPEFGLVARVGRNLHSLLNGDSDPLEIIYKSDLITQWYTGGSLITSLHRIRLYSELLSHKNPCMKIIEVGAGTGSLTRFVMDGVAPRAKSGQRPSLPRFGSYDFTDISPSFFENVKNNLLEYQDRMNYQKLDMGANPIEQGFDAEVYDVVYCGLVLHALPHLEQGLKHARSLLKAGGKLIMLEPISPHNARVGIIFGVLPSWWLATEQSRRLSPLLSIDSWDKLLKATGFSGIEVCLPDEDDPDKQTFAVIIATAADMILTPMPEAYATNVLLDPSANLQQDVAKQLADLQQPLGTVNLVNMNHPISDSLMGSDCIVLNELEAPWLKKLSDPGLANIKKLTAEASNILWVTTGAGLKPNFPEQDLATALARNVRSESWNTKFTHLALECCRGARKMAQQIYAVHCHQSKASFETYEEVFREHQGQLFTARISESEDLNDYVYRKTVKQRPAETSLAQEGDRPLCLTISSPGQLETLHFVDDPGAATEPLVEDEILVKTCATGLDLDSVTTALGKMHAHYQAFGTGFAGYVVRAAQKTGFHPGDHVVGLTSNGAFRTLIRTKAQFLHKLPKQLTFEAAAAMVSPWAIAYYALIDKAGLQSGESILIHSGSGGIGQAAIQLAKHRGAQIFVTAGTEKKQQFIIDNYDIDAGQVFSSRNTAFVDAIERSTEGRGVDVIVNRLTGRLTHASWSLLAPCGRFLEMQKSDMILGRALSGRKFLTDATFTAVDLIVPMINRPHSIKRALDEIFKLLSGGLIGTLCPPRTYSVGDIVSAFRSFQDRASYGTVAVRMDRTSRIQAVPSTALSFTLDANATYVIAGGFGGIGREVVKHMVTRGARNFLIATASQDPSHAEQRLLSEIAKPDVRIVGIRCDIADEEDVRAFVGNGAKTLPPIKGVIQSTLSLRDSLFTNLSLEDWQTPLRPKVNGTWNLHKHLPSKMDFFVVLSSIASLTGARGQASYAAGNAYQDALVRFRLSQGQKAFGINLGPVLSAGVVAERNIAEQLLSDGYQGTQLAECFAMLDWAFDPAHGDSHGDADDCQIITGFGGIRDPNSKQMKDIYWLQRPMFSHLRNYDYVKSTTEAGADAVLSTSTGDLLQSCANSATEACEVILNALCSKLSRTLSISIADVEFSKPIYHFGVDSLVCLEIRYWLIKEVKANLPVLEIMGAASLSDLSASAWAKSSYNKMHPL